MVCVSVWLQGIPQPIYQDCRDQQCVDAQKVVKKFVPQFQCPIPEGCTCVPCTPFIHGLGQTRCLLPLCAFVWDLAAKCTKFIV